MNQLFKLEHFLEKVSFSDDKETINVSPNGSAVLMDDTLTQYGSTYGFGINQ